MIPVVRGRRLHNSCGGSGDAIAVFHNGRIGYARI
jgi:hypothetical protein